MTHRHMTTAFLLVLSACGEAGEGENRRMRPAMVCMETECDREIQECRDQVDMRCDQCFDLCLDDIMDWGSTSCLDTCDRVCDSSHCRVTGCDDEKCADWEFFFVPSNDFDEDLEEACEAAVARDHTCGIEYESPCRHVARTYRPATIPIYECLAATPCSGDTTSCWTGYAVGTLGQEACARIEQVCGEPVDKPSWCEGTDTFEGYIREDVADALRWCFAQTDCDQLLDCVNSWIDAS